MSELLHLRCRCGMTLEVARALIGTALVCPHCEGRMVVPSPDDPRRDGLIGEYSAALDARPAGPPPRISETLRGVMRSALRSIHLRSASPSEEERLAGRVEEFRTAVVHGIATPGFRMVDEARRLGIDRADVGAVVKDVYRAFFRRCLEDGVVCAAERDALMAVAQRMCLHPLKKAELEAETTGKLLRERLSGMARDGRFDAVEAESLRALVRTSGMDWTACVREARDVAVHLVEQRFAFARADGRITREEAEEIRRLQEYFGLTGRDMDYVSEELNALRLRTSYLEGTLPVIDPPATIRDLDEDELCHAVESVWAAIPLEEAQARTAGGARHGAQRTTLVLTRRRIRVLGAAPFEAPLERLSPPVEEFVAVLQDGVVRRRRFLVLRGAGLETRVTAPDLERLDALVRGALRNAARASSPAAAGVSAAQVPSSVRTAVWRRDRGACAGCGATQGLEFVGTGATAQPDDPSAFRILCRRCRGG